jgi:glycosyltransferase involved in cell wall biosynthesis/GT2 family glycosyltransferase
MPDVSVVISTCNRAASLRQTLCALRWQTFDAFEVIVVNGPSTDQTEAVLADFHGQIRVTHCPEQNLSRSRNIGIGLAGGAIIAFLDDDAVPDPRWLAELLAGYDSGRVGGVGGIVYDHTGYALQYEGPVCDRRGNVRQDLPPPRWAYGLPGADPFVYLQGTNASFRRRCLVEVGGFDEEFDYYLDEVELCLRLLDRGYQLRQLDGAAVYHKSLASHVRTAKRVLRHPFPLVKNRFYFALQARRPEDSVAEVLRDCRRFAAELCRDARAERASGRRTTAELQSFEQDVRRAVPVGSERGLHGRRRSIVLPPATSADFLPFATVRPAERFTFCLVSQELPPAKYGGIGRLTLDLAQGFAALGHEVHLLTRSPDHNRVDLEDGVWIHRLQEAPGPWRSRRMPRTVRRCLNHAAAIHHEVRRLGATRLIDLVSVPVWDSEGLYCLLDPGLTCVLTLQTTLRTTCNLHPGRERAPDLAPLLALEGQTIRAARYVHAISQAVLENVRRDYSAPEAPTETWVVPPGIVDRAANSRPRAPDGRVRVLFVGRLEKRKGVDVLLEAAAILAPEYPHIDFVVVGDDTIQADRGGTYRVAFGRRYGRQAWSQRVVFAGLLSEPELDHAYADCDIFCLPARYESFGLVLVEAMMFGKPVVGCAAGGMREIVADGFNGFLAKPGDVRSLVGCLRPLIKNATLRQDFGTQSRLRYAAEFSAQTTIRNTLEAYTEIIQRARAGKETAWVPPCRRAA